MMGKYRGVWKYRVQIWEWVIIVAMSTQVYHDLPYHIDHDLANNIDHDLAHHLNRDLADQLSLFLSLSLEWAAYKLESMTPKV